MTAGTRRDYIPPHENAAPTRSSAQRRPGEVRSAAEAKAIAEGYAWTGHLRYDAASPPKLIGSAAEARAFMIARMRG